MPVVAGQSGNTGGQALAVTLRGLALREIGVNAWLRVLRKEMVSGLLNGLGIALVTSLSVYLWSESTGLALVIGLAMVASMTIAGYDRGIHSDPDEPARSGPRHEFDDLLTTVTDVCRVLFVPRYRDAAVVSALAASKKNGCRRSGYCAFHLAPSSPRQFSDQ